VKVAHGLVALLLISLSTAASACYCQRESALLARLANNGFGEKFERVFHGRVTRAYSAGRADAVVLEAFKGGSGVVALHSTGNEGGGDCGVAFTPGEEFIYMTRAGGAVIWCWRLAATPEVLAHMRRSADQERSRAP